MFRVILSDCNIVIDRNSQVNIEVTGDLVGLNIV